MKKWILGIIATIALFICLSIAASFIPRQESVFEESPSLSNTEQVKIDTSSDYLHNIAVQLFSETSQEATIYEKTINDGELNEEKSLYIEYNHDVFEESTIKKIANVTCGYSRYNKIGIKKVVVNFVISSWSFLWRSEKVSQKITLTCKS